MPIRPILLFAALSLSTPLTAQGFDRFRADGSNEVRGILPNELIAFRADDGPGLRARLLAERLPAAIARARALAAAN